MKNYDITGQTFGHWTVIRKDDPHPGCRNSYWICRCVCGTERSVNRSTLVNGRSSSCGCVPSDKRKGINMTHGMSRTRLFHEWTSMRRRCSNPNGKCAKNYCLKGITVCEEWNKFELFRDWAFANGYSDSMTIDRIDNDKGYSPDNCRWVPFANQARNKTNNRIVEYNGEKWCLRTLCTHLGFPYKTAHRRYMSALRAGKPINIEKLFEPVHSEKIATRYRNQSSDQ